MKKSVHAFIHSQQSLVFGLCWEALLDTKGHLGTIWEYCCQTQLCTTIIQLDQYDRGDVDYTVELDYTDFSVKL